MKHWLTSLRQTLTAMAVVIAFMILSSGAMSDAVQPTDYINEQNRHQAEVDDVTRQFEQYSLDIEEDYQNEKEAIENAYRHYLRVIEEEFRAYEEKILELWPKAEVSTKKKWVEYSDDYKIKKAVDFESGEIRIEIILPPDGSEEEEAMLRRQLSELLRQDQQGAFERDELARNIEKRIKEQSPQHVQTGKVEKNPILAGALTGKKQPTEAELKKALENLRQRGEVSSRPAAMSNARVASLKTTLPEGSLQRRALDYKEPVSTFARERGVDDALVYAVIHTESAFNPMARSHIPAFGLMQIVPQSAGKDVSRMIYGQEKLLSPSYLYNERNNINAGTTYLYILYYRYLNKINDPTSRLYCTIAAYNTGAGNVARAFTGTTSVSRAVGLINRMTPQQVYNHLRRNLPHQETRDYLERVVRRMDIYRGL